MWLINDRSSNSNTTGIRTTFKAESHYRYELRIDMQGRGWNMFIVCFVIQYCGDICCFFGCVIAEAKYVIGTSLLYLFVEICFYISN
jgi:hypothetical protein